MGGSVLGITIAPAKVRVVCGTTARNIAPRRKCTCASKGFLRVIVSVMAKVYTADYGEKWHRKKSFGAAQEARREDSHSAGGADPEQEGARACVYAGCCGCLLVCCQASERSAALYDEGSHGRCHLRRLRGTRPRQHRRTRRAAGDGREGRYFQDIRRYRHGAHRTR